jgi:hypothetical protein
MQRAVTELAYLRDALTRGIIDQTGRVREKELFAKIRAIRAEAVVLPEGRAAYPTLRRRRIPALQAYAPPSYPGPAGLGGNYPAPNANPAPPGLPRAPPLRPPCRWGKLLPSTRRSTPAGNRLESREPQMTGRQLTPLESALTKLRAAAAPVSLRCHYLEPMSSARSLRRSSGSSMTTSCLGWRRSMRRCSR